jgi:hypothetical protein
MTLRPLWILPALAALNAHAHPGHEPFSEGTKHFLANPNHFAPPLLFGVALVLAAQLLQRRRERAFVRILAIAISAFAILS